MDDHGQSIVGVHGVSEMSAAGSDGAQIAERRVPGGGRHFDALREWGKNRWSGWKRFASRPRKRPADDWRQWSRFRLWRKTRPFWGSLLIIVASLLVLWGPIEFLPFAMLPGSSVWAGILVGALLLVMGIIQLLAPSYALITGAIAIVLSLVSLLVAVGGLGIGMILGLIGGAIGVAWRPVTGALRGPSYRRVAGTTGRPVIRERKVVKAGQTAEGVERRSVSAPAGERANERIVEEAAGEQVVVPATGVVEAEQEGSGQHGEGTRDGSDTAARGPRKTRIIRQNAEENRRS